MVLFICGKINDTFCCCYANSRISNSPRAAFVSHEIRCPYGRTAFLNFGRIDDHHLHALPEVVCHPFFLFARRDGILHDLGADAGIHEKALEPCPAVQTYPVHVEQYALAGTHLAANDLQRAPVFFGLFLRRTAVLRHQDRVCGDRMQDRLMAVRLVRISHHEVQGHGQQLLGELTPFAAAVLEDPMESVLQIVIGSLLVLRKPERYRDLLVFRQVLAHIHEREEHAVLQQEAAVHQRRNARLLTGAFFPLRGAPVVVVPAFRYFVSVLCHAVFPRKLRGGGIRL